MNAEGIAQTSTGPQRQQGTNSKWGPANTLLPVSPGSPAVPVPQGWWRAELALLKGSHRLRSSDCSVAPGTQKGAGISRGSSTTAALRLLLGWKPLGSNAGGRLSTNKQASTKRMGTFLRPAACSSSSFNTYLMCSLCAFSCTEKNQTYLQSKSRFWGLYACARNVVICTLQ